MPEFDSTAAVMKARPTALGALIRAGRPEHRLWSAEELGPVFCHQMSAPIAVDLGALGPTAAARLKLLSEADGLVLKSFADLLQHPAPPLELLILAKDFAKANMDQPASSLPGEIASALYYASISVARLQLDQRITSLGDADLRSGLAWAIQQPWLDEPTRQLLVRALEKLSAGRPDDR